MTLPLVSELAVVGGAIVSARREGKTNVTAEVIARRAGVSLEAAMAILDSDPSVGRRRVVGCPGCSEVLEAGEGAADVVCRFCGHFWCLDPKDGWIEYLLLGRA